MSERTSSSGGIGFAGALFLLFLGLKLTDNIDWSWWWVTAPLWGGLALIAAIVVIGGCFLGLLKCADLVMNRAGNRR